MCYNCAQKICKLHKLWLLQGFNRSEFAYFTYTMTKHPPPRKIRQKVGTESSQRAASLALFIAANEQLKTAWWIRVESFQLLQTDVSVPTFGIQ